MDYLKIQTEFMRDAYNRDHKGKNIRNAYGYYKGDVALMTNTYVCLIPKNKCWLNLETVFNKPPINAEKILDGDFQPVVDTNEIVIKTSDRKQYKLHKFKLNEEEIYINDDILKKFKLDSPTYEGVGSKSIVLIYEYGYLVAGILPTNINYFD